MMKCVKFSFYDIFKIAAYIIKMSFDISECDSYIWKRKGKQAC